jgi:protein-glutamine gamma-glutamyltransferase
MPVLKHLLNLPKLLRSLIRGALSPKVEESLRLRVLGLAVLWLAALSLVWAGGSLWLSLGGGLLGTLGYGVGWWRRRHRSRLWPVLIAGAIIAVSLAMRSPVLEAFTGNWLPLGQLLVLVQALAGFDMRTRGGIYTGLILSGVVLFFASQQAFSEAFGLFLIGYLVALLAFLSVSFLEDGVNSARVYWSKHQPGTLAFWAGTACGVFVLAGLAFWLMPRGETSLGAPQVAILPFSAGSLDGDMDIIPDIDPVAIRVALNRGAGDLDQEMLPGIMPLGPDSDDQPSGTGSAMGSPVGFMAGEAFLGNTIGPKHDKDVVFFVRSEVASYWKGRTLDTFDGRYWRASSAPADFAPSRSSAQILVNQESQGLDNRLRYAQTIFVRRDAPHSLYTGYRGVRIIADEGSLQDQGLRAGDSYRVLSAHPRLSVDGLRQIRTGRPGNRYLTLPPDSEPLQALAREITRDAVGDFARLERIMGYLAVWGSFDSHRPGDLMSSASLEEFLLEGQPGSALDYATATVILARASGLPARLALGYLPGTRDPLSGAFMVRERDAHAWAEVYFEGKGWVPIDTAPRPDITLLFNNESGVGYLFQSGFGERAFQAVLATPGEVVGSVPDLLNQQSLWIGGAVMFLGMSLALGWRRFQ